MSLKDRLADVGIRLSNYGVGNHKTTCPQCSAQRKNKRDPCLSVTIDDEDCVWLCHNCGWRGGLKENDAARPPPAKRRRPAAPPVRPEQWTSVFRDLPLKAISWLLARGLSPAAIEAADIRWATDWFGNEQVDCLAFPYRRPGGEIVNVKYRTLDKRFKQRKDGETLFWRIDQVDLDGEALVITEGELDVLALMTAGVENAISVPDGAPLKVKDGQIDPDEDHKFSYVWAAKEELERFTKIILAVDNDEPGRALAEELARRIGREKCWLVTWPQGCKDANDVLLKAGPDELARCIRDAKPHPIKSLFDFGQFEGIGLALIRGGRKRGALTGWSSLDEFMTIRPGELSVVTGVPGSGKSEWIDALMVNLARSEGWRFTVCSFENPSDEHLVKLVEKVTGLPAFVGQLASISDADFTAACAWIRGRFFSIRAEDESPTIEWVLETARAAVMRHGIKGLVIDPYNEIEHKRPPNMTETEYVSQVLGKVKRFAQSHGVHVWFVAHPAKPSRDKSGKPFVPTLYDISGGAHWFNKADLGVVIDSDLETDDVDIYVRKVRFKAVGKPGTVRLKYDRATGTYRNVGDIVIPPPADWRGAAS